jgi:hypothetical protein
MLSRLVLLDVSFTSDLSSKRARGWRFAPGRSLPLAEAPKDVDIYGLATGQGDVVISPLRPSDAAMVFGYGCNWDGAALSPAGAHSAKAPGAQAQRAMSLSATGVLCG